MTRNVTKEHVIEIFTCYGEIKNVEFATDRMHPQNGRGFAYVEYVKTEDAENAMKHMDGGQVDGMEITVAPVLLPKPRMMRRSPMRNNRQQMRGWGGGGGRRNNSPPRYNRDNRDRRERDRSPWKSRGGGGGGGRRTRSPVQRSDRRRRSGNSSDSSR